MRNPAQSNPYTIQSEAQSVDIVHTPISPLQLYPAAPVQQRPVVGQAPCTASAEDSAPVPNPVAAQLRVILIRVTRTVASRTGGSRELRNWRELPAA